MSHETNGRAYDEESADWDNELEADKAEFRVDEIAEDEDFSEDAHGDRVYVQYVPQRMGLFARQKERARAVKRFYLDNAVPPDEQNPLVENSFAWNLVGTKGRKILSTMLALPLFVLMVTWAVTRVL